MSGNQEESGESNPLVEAYRVASYLRCLRLGCGRGQDALWKAFSVGTTRSVGQDTLGRPPDERMRALILRVGLKIGEYATVRVAQEETDAVRTSGVLPAARTERNKRLQPLQQ